MRDIKFRAWHEKLNRMIFDISVNNSVSEWIDENKKSWCIEDDIMQYTGLKDKNGQDIYEGDILKNKKGDISFIVFSNLGCFDVNSYYGGGYPWYTQINEIIGNIHQNKY